MRCRGKMPRLRGQQRLLLSLSLPTLAGQNKHLWYWCLRKCLSLTSPRLARKLCPSSHEEEGESSLSLPASPSLSPREEKAATTQAPGGAVRHFLKPPF